MRAITQRAIRAFLTGAPFVEANTEVHVTERPGEILVELVLHGNPIARRWETSDSDETWIEVTTWTEVTTAGWDTVTTRERLNGIPGVRVWRAKNELYLNDAPWHGAWTVVAPSSSHPSL